MSTHISRRVTLLAGTVVGAAILVQPATSAAAHGAAQTSAAHHTYIVKEQPGNAAAGYVFASAMLHVGVGDTVTWKDTNSTPHNIVGVKTMVIHRLTIGTATYSVTFKKTGTYHYICQVHPGMMGVIVVK